MTAYTTRMPQGFVGGLTRPGPDQTVSTEIPDSSTPPLLYGVCVKLVSGKIQPLASSDASSVIYGFNVRPYPSQSSTNAYGASVPSPTAPQGVLKRGYILALLKSGTAAKGAQAYVVTTAGGTVVVGDIVTSTSPSGGGTAVAITGAFFNGPADSSGVVEIAYNL